MILSYRISHQRDQMPMMNTTNNLNFSSELPFALSTACLELLNGHHSPIWQPTFVNISKPTLTNDILTRKSIGYFHQLFIGEKGLSTAYDTWFWSPRVVHLPSLTPIVVSISMLRKWVLWTIRSWHPHRLLSIVMPICRRKISC